MFDPFELGLAISVAEVEIKAPKLPKIPKEKVIKEKVIKEKRPKAVKEIAPVSEKKLKRMSLSHKHNNMIRPATIEGVIAYNRATSNFVLAKIYIIDTIAKIIYIDAALEKFKDNLFGFEVGANKLSYNFATSIEPRDKTILLRYYYDVKDLSVGFLKNFVICQEIKSNIISQEDHYLREDEISPF